MAACAGASAITKPAEITGIIVLKGFIWFIAPQRITVLRFWTETFLRQAAKAIPANPTKERLPGSGTAVDANCPMLMKY
jgi:hypothetical protein